MKSEFIKEYPQFYLDKYKIEGSINIDDNPCFNHELSYENFQEDMDTFKDLLIGAVRNGNKPLTFYKFGDGDFYFLQGVPLGSASPGKRALSKQYADINLKEFTSGALLNDYYTCEIYPENRIMFKKVIEKEIDFPAEYGYALTANRWLTKTFSGEVGLIGGKEKIKLAKELMKEKKYQEYLGLEKFEDYIYIPQKFACDDIEATEKMVAEQLKNSTSKIFLVGIGHVKSALLHRLKKYRDAVFLDIGSGIDALAGIIRPTRPFMAGWENFKLNDKEKYKDIDFLA